MSVFKRPHAESGPVIYHPDEAASELSARPYRTLVVDAAPPQSAAPGLSRLARVNRLQGFVQTLMISVAAIGSFCGVIYWTNAQSIAAGGPGLPPILNAGDRSAGEQPANAGGKRSGNEDNAAYGRLDPRREASPSERLELPQRPRTAAAADLPVPARDTPR